MFSTLNVTFTAILDDVSLEGSNQLGDLDNACVAVGAFGSVTGSSASLTMTRTVLGTTIGSACLGELASVAQSVNLASVTFNDVIIRTVDSSSGAVKIITPSPMATAMSGSVRVFGTNREVVLVDHSPLQINTTTAGSLRSSFLAFEAPFDHAVYGIDWEATSSLFRLAAWSGLSGEFSVFSCEQLGRPRAGVYEIKNDIDCSDAQPRWHESVVGWAFVLFCFFGRYGFFIFRVFISISLCVSQQC